MKFEESDEGKRVVDREGNVIGEVATVRDGIGYVRKTGEESVIDAITTSLGWDDSAIQELEREHVDAIDDTEVRLRAFWSGPSGRRGFIPTSVIPSRWCDRSKPFVAGAG
ncbi:hypothetical protein [Halococcus hamelinensis]|uniref:PRC-barrel domain-containing protein n=1 Tax=Halococcus hamelinensis 100A6 TaxID=1132509 RepID=M0LXV1_9EURY|nr:hypothetical protein [Halococcus hamelinensis]EMA37988.1 hypothetical protein C447_11145 [Halococcus hamelinensis 100A6]